MTVAFSTAHPGGVMTLDHDEGLYSLEEVRAQLVAQLSAPQLSGPIFRVARKLLRQFRLQDSPEDIDELVHEALVRSLEGRRPGSYRRGQPILYRFCGVMRSVCYDRRRAETRRLKDVRIGEGTPEGEALLLKWSQAPATPEAEMEAKQMLGQVIAELADTPLAVRLLKAQLQGYRGEELRICLGLDRRAYESLLKKVRRRLLTRFSIRMEF